MMFLIGLPGSGVVRRSHVGPGGTGPGLYSSELGDRDLPVLRIKLVQVQVRGNILGVKGIDRRLLDRHGRTSRILGSRSASMRKVEKPS